MKSSVSQDKIWHSSFEILFIHHIHYRDITILTELSSKDYLGVMQGSISSQQF